MAKENSEVAVKGTQAVTIFADFEADADKGFDNIGQDDVALPWLKILTNMSPQINDVAGATPGMIFNTVTGELYDGKKGIYVVPCAYIRNYLEWSPRGAKGGTGAPVNIYPATSDILTKCHKEPNDSKDYLDSGNYVENTANHYVLLLDQNEGWSHAIISMKSTQLKKSRKWNSMMMSVKMDGANGKFTPPPYSQIYLLTVVKEQRDAYVWHGWEIERIGPIDNPSLYQSAKAFAQSISAGEINVKYESEETPQNTTDVF